MRRHPVLLLERPLEAREASRAAQRRERHRERGGRAGADRRRERGTLLPRGLEPREEKGSFLSKIYTSVMGRTAAAQ